MSDTTNLYFKTDYRLRDLARPSTPLVTEIVRELNYRMDLLQRAYGTGTFATSPKIKEIEENTGIAEVLVVLLFREGYIEVEAYAGMSTELRKERLAALRRRRERLIDAAAGNDGD
jgi:hypothetical protein